MTMFMIFGPPHSGAEDVGVGNEIVGKRVTMPDDDVRGERGEGVHVGGRA